jgi:ribose transport system ATP-binding protein
MTHPSEQPLLEVRGIAKQFPGVVALDGVGLTLSRGEVLAVVGENGAGKSTLMKILAGVLTPDGGEVFVDGEPMHHRAVHDAINAGVVLIHQELNLAENLDVAANICLGREPHRFGFVDRKGVRDRAAAALKQIAPEIDPQTRVEDLTVGRRQLVEIAKAISLDARVLIMDEPTSSLSTGEMQRLFAVIGDLRSRGVGIVYISHRLAEVDEIADRVVVLRDGRLAGELARSEISHDAIVRLMIGRTIEARQRHASTLKGEPLLQVHGLATRAFPLEQISLSVAAGEIVGIAGLVGAGRTELLETIFGIEPPARGNYGTCVVRGKAIRIRRVADAVRAGLALVPEDRQRDGLIAGFSVRSNIGLPGLMREQRLGFMNRTKESQDSSAIVLQLSIVTDDDRRPAQTLSGGNQQKVVLGKWLPSNPSVLLLDEPTRGVDIGARAEIYRIIESLAANGTAVLFVSSDMEEVIALAQRVIVMKDGQISGELVGDDIEEERIMRLATAEEVA